MAAELNDVLSEINQSLKLSAASAAVAALHEPGEARTLLASVAIWDAEIKKCYQYIKQLTADTEENEVDRDELVKAQNEIKLLNEQKDEFERDYPALCYLYKLVGGFR